MQESERYVRHYQLAGFGKPAQQKLAHSRVLVIGAGGLGCAVLQYLVASGVGQVDIVDHDTIEIGNLQRQVLYNTAETGLAKAEVAAEKLRALNPDVLIEEHVVRLSTSNAVELIGGCDVVVDCCDNFATRYLLADATRLLDKPLVFGAIFQYEGQVAVFNVPQENGVKTTYRHLFPDPPGPLDAPDCNTAGVLGVLPGTIGILQATETIKILTGVGRPLFNRLMSINLLDYTTLILDIPAAALKGPAEGPASLEEFKQMDYEDFCGARPVSGVKAIDYAQLKQMANDKDVLVIDVRSADEQPRLKLPHIVIPYPELPERLGSIHQENLVLVCQSGKRSLAAADLLREKLGENCQVSHLDGGLMAIEKTCL